MRLFLFVFILSSLAVATFGHRYYSYNYRHGSYYQHKPRYRIRCSRLGCHRYVISTGKATPAPPRYPTCADDSDCDSSKFCDRYLTHCRACKPLNGLCRRDENCCEGKVCEWGCCREPNKPGSEGSACKYDVDCNQGLCCAKEQSRFICKKLGILNDDCYEPEGGLGYSMHHKCPCGQGLRCQEFLYRWSRYFYMYHTRHHKCVQRSTPVTETPSTEAPSTEAPSTEAPSTEAPSTEVPFSGDDVVLQTEEPSEPNKIPEDEESLRNKIKEAKQAKKGKEIV